MAQRHAEVGQSVDLAFGGLAGAARQRDPIVAVDRAGACRHRARRPLGPIVGVTGDAALGADVGTDHLEQVELRSHLDQRAALFGRQVELANIAAQHTEYSRR